MSRTAAKEAFTVSEFKNQMSGIYTTSVSKDTLDECPMAYKGMQDIVNNIEDTSRILMGISNFSPFLADTAPFLKIMASVSI